MYENIRPEVSVAKQAGLGLTLTHTAKQVPGSIPARGEENFGVRTRFL